MATERVTLTETGQVRLTLRRPWSDGTTHLQFEPLAFLERLAVLVPRPRVNLLLYYGVLAPRAAWRQEVVSLVRRDEVAGTAIIESDVAKSASVLRPTERGYRWAELLRRTFDIDVLACPRCGGRLVLIALIEQPEMIARILGHLGLPNTLPRPAPARRAPRGVDEWQDDVPVRTEPT